METLSLYEINLALGMMGKGINAHADVLNVRNAIKIPMAACRKKNIHARSWEIAPRGRARFLVRSTSPSMSESRISSMVMI